MKNTFFTLLTLISFNTYAAEISDVAFLSGCWQGQDGDITTTESWSQPSANILMAYVQMKNLENIVTEYEFLRIEKKDDGNLVFTPYINGQQVPDFQFNSELSKDSDADKAVFTNLDNDFPKFISYSRPHRNPTKLNIQLKGETKKKESLVIEFQLNNISCDHSKAL